MTGWDILFRSQQQAQGIRRAYEQDVLQRDAQRDATALQTGQLHQQQRQLDQRDVQMAQQQAQFDETMQQRRSEQAQQQSQFEQRMTIAEIEALLYAQRLQEESEWRQHKMAQDQVLGQVELQNAQLQLQINQQKFDQLNSAQAAEMMNLQVQQARAELEKTLASIGGTGESSIMKAVGALLEEYGPAGMAMRGMELSPDLQVTIHQPGSEGYNRLQEVFKEPIAEIKRQRKLEMQLETLKAMDVLREPSPLGPALPADLQGYAAGAARGGLGEPGKIQVDSATQKSQVQAQQLDSFVEVALPQLQQMVDGGDFQYSALTDSLNQGGVQAHQIMMAMGLQAEEYLRNMQGKYNLPVSREDAFRHIMHGVETDPLYFGDLLIDAFGRTHAAKAEALQIVIALSRTTKNLDWGTLDEAFMKRWRAHQTR